MQNRCVYLFLPLFYYWVLVMMTFETTIMMLYLRSRWPMTQVTRRNTLIAQAFETGHGVSSNTVIFDEVDEL